MKSLTDTFPLAGGGSIPCLGLGTYKAEKQECYDAVRAALEIGYRHIDTAAFYGNEDAVGQAIRDSGISRSDIFVTTKVWHTDQGYDKTMRAFEKSFEALNLGYIDLYLIHWPIPKGHLGDYKQLNAGSWRAIVSHIKGGALRFGGVSNFLPQHIEELAETGDYMPVVNQIECHPGLNQDETVDYCRKKGILVEAWRPLLRGGADKFPLLAEIARAHNCSATQICIAWLLARGICPLPKSVHADRIKENADVFGINLSEEEVRLINGLPEYRLGSTPLDFAKQPD